ncbi:hypothetical protein FCH28_26735 [Streptomyces piniterrae]|uniref:OmpR/PhoB-type domain-containing protein n=1 Tax=Streptomyces piniterrae TaxID=2571125 RepID=A0A4U0MY53_9ACTN|nr:SAV_2336 N-terminal domain-related protein [Streptomyces piniterrae]TJZ46119.1 hypothetical protein FCH28_26735 [Streptomyces piniterrae]
MIDRLRQAMSAAGYDLGATELLDVLWLARVMEGRAGERGETEGADPADPARSAAAGSESGEVAESGELAEGAEGAAGAEDAEGAECAGSGEAADCSQYADPAVPDGRTGPTGPTDPLNTADSTGSTDPADPITRLAPDTPPRRALYAIGSQGGGAGGERARPARAPGRRALSDAQQLGRALRPLRRSRDHPHRTVTDIEATVRLAAETGFLDIVSRPDQERRWSAVLLVDCSPSMQVWGSLAAELRHLLSRSTVFRSVRLRTIDPQNPGAPVRHQQAAGAAVTFLLTDGTSHGWRGPQAVRTLSAWARGGPMAVLNPLPRRLWRGTALDARPRLLAAPDAFDPVGRLVVCDPLSGEPDPDAAGALALPVLHPTASAVGQWAGLLTRPGVPHLVETALLAEAPARTPHRPHGTAEELVAHFRGAFSPEAYRLAVRLSAIRPLTTPLMQLVRAATMRDAGPTHVAEILLGGLLERADRADEDGPAAAARTLDRALGMPPGQLVQPVYDFRPGVRELLFSGLGAEQAVEVVESVGRSLEPYMGRLPDFPVLMGDAAGELRLHRSARAFAVLASPVLERMGGTAPEFAPSAASAPATGAATSTPAPPATVESPPRSPSPRQLRFTVLGPVGAWRGDTPLVSGSLRQRTLLAALLLGRGRPATEAELIDALWGDEPPQAARNSLYAYTARLRRELRDDPVALIREADGFALRAPDGSPPALDLAQAERLIQQARDAGNADAARQLRDRALALWDGEPLAGLPGPFAQAQRERLERWRQDLMDGVYRPFEDAAYRPFERQEAETSAVAPMASTEPPDAQHDETLSHRLARHLAMGRQVHEIRYPGDRMVNDLARASTDELPAVTDGAQALADWSDETPDVLTLVRQAMVGNAGSVRHAADLLLLVQVTAESGAHAAAFEPAARVVATRAAMEGDGRAEGRARVALAEAYLAVGRFAEAEHEAQEAGRLARASHDPLTGFRAPLAAGLGALHEQRHDDAERHLTEAWEHCRTRNDELGEAAVLAALARLWAATGTGNEAVLFAERSVAIHRRVGGAGPRLAHGLYALAEALLASGRYADALRELFQALPLFEADRQWLWAGRTRCRTAEAMVSLIRPSEAEAAAQDAATRLLVPGGERWRADALLALGHAETALGRKQSAQAHWREALAVYEAFGAPEAHGTRALLRDKDAPSSSAARKMSRTADTARAGTALRDLTAAVRTLRDQLRLQAAAHVLPSATPDADIPHADTPHTGTPHPDTPHPGAPYIDTPDLDTHLVILEAAEAELDGRVGDFERTGRLARPPGADLDRLRTVVDAVTASEALPAATIDAAREVDRRLGP